MMTDPIYDQVADAVNARTGYPCYKCPELLDILEFLFTMEEAELALKMPMIPVSAEGFAKDIGGDPKEVERILENMANNALVFTTEVDGVTNYVLVSLLPGTFEVQFMKGVVDDRTKQLARLFQNYFDAAANVEAATPRSYTSVPFSRVIAVEQEIPAGVEIHSFDKVSKYIAESDLISIGACYCRFFGELLGNPCTKPRDNCFSFGTQAKFMVERGFNKAVSKEEALRVLTEAEDAGLVHCSSNVSEAINFICNCCSCHCGIMQSVKIADRPNAAANSSFILAIDEDECIGCGDCVERCQVEAITVEGDMLIRDDVRCIGCGLCVSTCLTGALKLVPREEITIPPANQMELGAAMIASYQEQEAG